MDKNKKSLETSESVRRKVIRKHYEEKVDELTYIDGLKYVIYEMFIGRSLRKGRWGSGKWG